MTLSSFYWWCPCFHVLYLKTTLASELCCLLKLQTISCSWTFRLFSSKNWACLWRACWTSWSLLALCKVRAFVISARSCSWRRRASVLRADVNSFRWPLASSRSICCSVTFSARRLCISAFSCNRRPFSISSNGVKLMLSWQRPIRYFAEVMAGEWGCGMGGGPGLWVWRWLMASRMSWAMALRCCIVSLGGIVWWTFVPKTWNVLFSNSSSAVTVAARYIKPK